MEHQPHQSPAVTASRKLLIIDDDEDDYMITRDMLTSSQRERWAVDWASTFEDGRNKLFVDNYQAVLVDYDLGKHTGLDLIREAAQRGYPAPLILLTGRGSYEIDLEAMQAGAALYLTKNEANPLLLERSIRYAIEIKQRERALQESERREKARVDEINAILDAVPAVVWIARDREARQISGNKAAYELLRVPKGINMSKSAADEEAPRNFKVFQNGRELTPEELPIQRAASAGAPLYDFEEDVVFENGDVVHLLGNVIPLFDQGQPCGAVGAFIDITDRKHAEEALQESEARYKSLFTTMQEGFALGEVIVDEQGDPVSFRFLEINEAFLQQTGLTREILGRNVTEVLVNLEPDWIDTYCTVALTGEPVRFERFNVDTKRHYDVFCYSPSQGKFAILFRDISREKQFEQSLQQSEARFRQLADALPQLVWTAQPDGTVDYYNQRYKEFNGIAPKEGGIWEWGPVLHPDDVQPTLDSWMRAVQTGGVYQIEHRVQKSDGNYHWHLSRGFPVRDENGQVVRWFGTATDIHDLKETETMLAQYADKLKRSNQELEQFAFVASHDLQEPLRKIRLFGSSIQQKLSGKIDAETEDHFKRMINASDRMQAMIRDLLELSRVSTQGQPFAPVDLSQVAAEVISDLETRITRAKGEVIIDPLPTIEADVIQMHQVLQNLISNALKFHKPGTPPVVRVSGETTWSQTDLRPMVALRVQDNGIGFDDQYLEQILQPFNRLHGRNEYEGNGIGLAIVKKIIDRHQGEISVRSQPEVGSTFIIRLPQKQT